MAAVLRLVFNETDGSTTFTDTSASAHSPTVGGNAQVDSDAKYGIGSLLLDGNADYLRYADSADWSFSTGDLTLRFWVKPTSIAADTEILAHRDTGDTNNFWFVRLTTAGKIRVYAKSGGVVITDVLSTATLSTGAWQHVAVVRESGHVNVFVGGVEGTADTTNGTGAWPDPSVYLWVGAGDSISGYFNGRIDDLEIDKGTALCPGTSSFTPGPIPQILWGDGSATGAATVSGTGVNVGTIARTGTAAGTSTATAVGNARIASVAASAGAATAAGVGVPAVVLNVPFALDRIIAVSVGCPFHVNIESSVATITVPFHAGTYVKVISVPFYVNIPTAVATITVPFHVYGDLSTEAAADFVHWRPKVVLDGTDISAKLIGALEIEADEMASVVASFSFLPAAGAVDPLAWVGKTVTISWQRYLGGALANTVLRFTGVVSDPTWDADERVLSISATSDLQGRLDRMTKTQIDTLLTSVSPRFSEYVFGDPADMSGWEYAQALISTTNAVLWQDTAGVIKVTSTLAKATADYTFTVADIIAGSLGDSPQYPSRQEMVNQIAIDFGYRFKRRRQRQITCVFRSVDLDTPSTYLSGNMGGWELPQRTQVESAANSGGWTVNGDITYRDVWPNGYYPSYSDQGTPTMIGLSLSSEVAADWCIGATWKAARRWLQTVTETATLTVNATESQAVIGILADNESYSLEDDATDEEWESSLEYDDYVSGATLMSNGVDKRSDLDELRDEYEDAVEIAVLKAKNDILRAHRGTVVTFSAPFLAALNLSHTVAIDTGFLDCKGKVRRITDTWNIDTGESLSTVDVALYRHNGAGLVSDTTIAAPEKAADPTEAAPSTRLNLKLYIGGQDDRPKWSTVETESGYFVNLPFNPNDGSATLTGGWSRNPLNPQVAPRVYEEGFSVQYPDIAATYADPNTAASTAAFEVAIPEDSLVLISG